MQEKLREILESATGWMTANEIADKGRWRSAANVGLSLKQMHGIEHRKSAKKKMSNGMPSTEYKLVDKTFGDSETKEQVPIRTNSQTEPMLKRPPASELSKPAIESGSAELRAKLALAEKMRDEHLKSIEVLQSALEKTDARIDVIGTMLINIEGSCIEEKLGKAMHQLVIGKAKIADLETAVDMAQQTIHRMELESEQAEEAIDVKDAARGYLVVAPKRKPAKLIKAESAVAKAKATAKVTGRSEVFALVPVGIATRKQIQAVEFNEQNNRGLNHATT